MKQPAFTTFIEAETSIKTSVLQLSTKYIKTIKTMVPVLKKASTNNKIEQKELIQYQTLYSEANDHLHNLVQLKLELNKLTQDETNLVLELSTEVLANTVQFLRNIPTQSN